MQFAGPLAGALRRAAYWYRQPTGALLSIVSVMWARHTMCNLHTNNGFALRFTISILETKLAAGIHLVRQNPRQHVMYSTFMLTASQSFPVLPSKDYCRVAYGFSRFAGICGNRLSCRSLANTVKALQATFASPFLVQNGHGFCCCNRRAASTGGSVLAGAAGPGR